MRKLRRVIPYSRVFWRRQGPTIIGDPENDEGSSHEPSVIYDGDPEILAGNVFKMWWVGGWTTQHLNYAESLDGITWTNLGTNPVIDNICRSYVFKDGTTYYCYGNVHPGLGQFDLYTSSDGVNWVLDTAAVISLGAGGQWDDDELGNIYVWKEGASDWRCFYEGTQSTTVWKIGYATSSDGREWVKDAGNPVISETGSLGVGHVYKSVANVYWMWTHYSSTGVLPTDVKRWWSNDLTTWNFDRNTFFRSTSDEGHASSVGQIADVCFLELNSTLYMWYAAALDGNSANNMLIKVATAPFTFEQIITMNEDT